MKICDVLAAEQILPALEATSRRHLFRLMVEHVTRDTSVDVRGVIADLIARETLGLTTPGGGVAIPHCRTREVDGPLLCFAHLKTPVNMDAWDGEPVDLVFLLLSPLRVTPWVRQILDHALALLGNQDTIRQFREAESRAAIWSIFRDAEAAAFAA